MKHPEDLLTAQQLVALRLAAQGHTIGEIARQMHVSNTYVARRLAEARRALGARNVAHAVIVAAASGVLSRFDVQDAMAARAVREEKE